uniref:Sec-independent protein translocase subunit TatA/TatB n=1 Tax=Adlercreutzia sp. ZJ473 TaxID=2722822 RepID=UPI0015543445
MFGIGGFELFLILLFGFLIFGPDKLPAMAKTAGQAIAKFRKAQEEMSGTLKAEVFDKDADAPFKNPLDVIDNAAAKTKKTADAAKKTAAEAAEKAESFAERKARYDRERAARKAAEKEAAEAAAAAAATAAAAEPVAEVAGKAVIEAA